MFQVGIQSFVRIEFGAVAWKEKNFEMAMDRRLLDFGTSHPHCCRKIPADRDFESV